MSYTAITGFTPYTNRFLIVSKAGCPATSQNRKEILLIGFPFSSVSIMSSLLAKEAPNMVKCDYEKPLPMYLFLIEVLPVVPSSTRTNFIIYSFDILSDFTNKIIISF